jgi:hypothetical protein
MNRSGDVRFKRLSSDDAKAWHSETVQLLDDAKIYRVFHRPLVFAVPSTVVEYACKSHEDDPKVNTVTPKV